jgi:WD40 repeat protein
MIACRRSTMPALLAAALSTVVYLTLSDADSVAAKGVPPGKEKIESTGTRPRTDFHGDPLPPGALARMGTVRLRNPGAVTRLAFAADGRTLASWHGGQGGSVCVWEAPSGREIRRGPVPHGRLYDLCLVAEGRSVAVLGNDSGEVFLWDFASGKEPAPRLTPAKETPAGGDPDQERFGFFVVSPDGKTLAAGSYGFANRKRLVQLWEVQTGKGLSQLKVVRKLDRNQGVIQWLAFTPDSRTIVSACPASDSAEDVLTFWDAGSGKEMSRMRTPLAYRHEAGAAVAFPTDGRFVALGLQDTTVRLWDVARAREMHRLEGHQRRGGLATIYSVAFSPDGKLLASAGSDGTVRLWDSATGKSRHVWSQVVGRVEALVFSRDGQTLAAGGHDGTVHLWEVGGKEPNLRGRHLGAVTSLALAPDGKTLATSDGEGVRLWEMASGRELRYLPAPDGLTTVLGFVDGGRVLRCGTSGKSLRVWDALAGKDIRSFSETAKGIGLAVAAVAPGNVIATVGQDAAVSLADISRGTKRPLTRALASGFPAALAAEGKAFAAAGLNPSGIHLWMVSPSSLEHRLLPPRRDQIYALAFSPDGRHFASGGQIAFPAFVGELPAGLDPLDAPGTPLLLWQVEAARLARKFQMDPGTVPEAHVVNCVAFAPDGKMVAAGESDGTLGLYETATGKLRLRLARHLDRVLSVTFSGDGRLLVSGSQDHTALVWDLSGRAPREMNEAVLTGLWTDLGGADVGRAFAAIQALAASRAKAVPFLSGRVKPAAPLLPPGRLAKLLKDLDAERYAVRARAVAELEALGELVEHALKKALKEKQSLEKSRRLERLLDKLARPWERMPASDYVRDLRALEVLEQIGSPDARKLLGRLADGAEEAMLTREARAALGRLSQRD